MKYGMAGIHAACVAAHEIQRIVDQANGAAKVNPAWDKMSDDYRTTRMTQAEICAQVRERVRPVQGLFPTIILLLVDPPAENPEPVKEVTAEAPAPLGGGVVGLSLGEAVEALDASPDSDAELEKLQALLG